MASVPARRLSGTLLRVLVIGKRLIGAKVHTGVLSPTVEQGWCSLEIAIAYDSEAIRQNQTAVRLCCTFAETWA